MFTLSRPSVVPVAAVVFALLLVAARPAGAAASGPSPRDIRDAIERGKTWLYSQQKPDGTWEAKPQRDPNDKPWNETGGQWGGTTALIVYAMLAAGEANTEPRLAKAIEFLKKAEMQGVYALGMRMQVWSRLPQTPEVRKLLAQDARKLLEMTKKAGNARGMHDYIDGPGDGYSHSRSNYAVLGLWAAAQGGVEVPDTFWAQVTEGWVRNQHASGGWTYKHPKDVDFAVTAGMTAAGVATLFITQDYLAPEGTGAGSGGAGRRTAPAREAIERGLNWLAENFDKQVAVDGRYDRDFPYPTAYAVERVGLAGGLRYIGPHDWYEKISAWMLRNQRPAGGWHRDNKGSGSPTDTAFALLTLARGRAPVAIAKLDHSAAAAEPAHAGDWNARPRDVANLVASMGRSSERELNWQIVSLDSPASDWQDAPILYLSGNRPPAFTEAHKARLRAYVEQGGMILAVADGSSKPFAEAIRKLGAELFEGREWRELPADHPVYVGQQFPRESWKAKPVVLGLSNGARELMVLLPLGDPSRFWQTNNTSTKEEFWQLGANLHQYAAGRENLRVRGESYLVQEDPSVQPTRTVRVARLQYAGNWDPEPGGWRRLAAVLRNQHQVKLEVVPRTLGTDDLSGFPLAHLTGTDGVKLDPAAIRAMRAYVEAGGTLLIDCAGGSSAFAGVIEPVFREFFIEQQPTPLPSDHPMLFRADGTGVEIDYRPFARAVLGDLTGESRLKSVTSRGRVAVIFSREDLSVGLVGTPVDGILGYTPATATELVGRLVLTQK